MSLVTSTNQSIDLPNEDGMPPQSVEAVDSTDVVGSGALSTSEDSLSNSFYAFV